MQKIKDKSRSEAKTQSEAWGKKIKVSHLQTEFTIFIKLHFMIVFRDVLNLEITPLF